MFITRVSHVSTHQTLGIWTMLHSSIKRLRGAMALLGQSAAMKWLCCCETGGEGGTKWLSVSSNSGSWSTSLFSAVLFSFSSTSPPAR
jgi:hypothetical protein